VTSSYITRDSSSKELGQVSSVAKQPEPAAKSNCFENVGLETHLSAYQNEVRHIAATTALVRSGDEHIQKILTVYFPGNGGSARMSSALEVQTA
jgi:hypothetical protein